MISLIRLNKVMEENNSSSLLKNESDVIKIDIRQPKSHIDQVMEDSSINLSETVKSQYS